MKIYRIKMIKEYLYKYLIKYKINIKIIRDIKINCLRFLQNKDNHNKKLINLQIKIKYLKKMKYNKKIYKSKYQDLNKIQMKNLILHNKKQIEV